MNPWIEFFLEVEEMRANQNAYFKDRNKVKLIKAQLSEKQVDQTVKRLKDLAAKKGIQLSKPQSNEPTE